MVRIKSRLFACLMSAALSVSFVGSYFTLIQTANAASTTVALIVNGNVITNTDIEQRKAFLRLQNQRGNLDQLARQELTDEMLKRIEMKRRNIEINLQEINEAYNSFASRNNMSPQQMGQMLTNAGLTPAHFKSYIMVQMGWGRLVSARFRAEGMVSEEEAVQRMLKNGGVKPTANEYLLQQVIFVVPANRRNAILNKRQQEANAFRTQINGCDSTRKLAQGKIDITIRNLGRILEQQLPSEWEKTIKQTAAGKATKVLQTQRGIEFLTVCSIRKVNDDRVAQLVFSIQESNNGEARAAQLEKKYIAELRKTAKIQKP